MYDGLESLKAQIPQQQELLSRTEKTFASNLKNVG